MKRFVSTTLAGLFAAGGLMIAPNDADAHGRHWRGRIGVHIGAPLIVAPWWHYSRPYYGYGAYPYPYHAPVVREEPTVYIEQNSADAAPQAQAQAPQQQYWYYCQDSRTYYPHVQTCTSPWQRVIPHAPQ